MLYLAVRRVVKRPQVTGSLFFTRLLLVSLWCSVFWGFFLLQAVSMDSFTVIEDKYSLPNSPFLRPEFENMGAALE